MKPNISPDLFTLITIPEAARLWNKHHMSVRRAIDEGRLEARQSFRCWLITRASLEKLWGKPQSPLMDVLFN